MTKKRKKSTALVVPPQLIENRIYFIWSHNVMLDEDLAELYEVPTKALTQAFRRNLDHFPDDFAFQLTREEWTFLRSQTVTSRSWGGRRYPPYAFTEQGVSMLSSVLKSKRAVLVNIEIMRTFVRLCQVLASHEELARQLAALESKYDAQFKVVFDAIRELMKPGPTSTRRIGFKSDDE